MSTDPIVGGDTTVFLTGGTGFLGSRLRSALAQQRAPVTLLVREGTEVNAEANETVQRGDVVCRDSIDLTGHDLVLHLAAQTSVGRAVDDPTDTWRVNADGTCNLLDAAREVGIDRFVYASTASVYGKPQHLPIDENHPTEPTEPYGASKLAGDALVRSYGRAYDLSVTVLRLFNVFGPGQPSHNVVATMVEQALSGNTIELGNLSPSRDFIYVDDVVRAFSVILRTDPDEITYNVGTGSDKSVREMAQLVADIVDRDVEIVSRTERERDEDVEIPRHVADSSRLRSLGWSASDDTRGALKETVAAFGE